MSVINTNITAMIGQQNLSRSASALSTAMERLSSGLRINSAKDDAAGLAIANRISTQISGLMQAQRNANDGISISQTAEGALNQVNDNLQRIRELTVQAANDTNSDTDLTTIQNEIGQRLEEINRISEETSFNGLKVLAADQGFNIQVGANDGQTITMDLKEMSATKLGLDTFDVSKTFLSSELASSASTETVPASLNITAASFNDTAAAATYDIYVEEANPTNVIVVNGGVGYNATYDSATNSLQFDSSAVLGDVIAATVTADYVQLTGTDGVDVGGGVTLEAQDLLAGGFTDANTAAAPALYSDDTGDYFVSIDGGTEFYAATVDMDSTSGTYGQVSYDSSVAGVEVGDGAGAPATAESGVLTSVSDPTSTVAIDVSGLDSAVVGNAPEVIAYADNSGYVIKGADSNGNDVYFEATVDQATGAVTQGDALTADPLSALDTALSSVDVLRSELGAMQNRFESAITSLGDTATNLSAARSRIEDADYAVEVSNMTRAQILQQAGTSVLAQANQVPQTVLSLLR
jgi:flagellin